MKTAITLAGTTVLFLAAVWLPFACLAGEAADGANDFESAFVRMKQLVGDWEGYSSRDGDRKVFFRYRLTGRQSALVEDYYGRPGAEAGMSTVYHMDGQDLRLTHYCGAGNQPRMKASRYDAQKGVLQFEFVDITNLSAPNAYHTRGVMITWKADDHISLEFRGLTDGKESDVAYTLQRAGE